MAFFGKKKSERKPPGPPRDPKWAKSATGRFPKFLDLDPVAAGLDRKSGVYAIWHTGIQPGWVFVGRSNNLAREFFDLGDNEEILEYRDRGSLFVSWCYIRDEFQDGAVTYLTMTVKPKVDNPMTRAENEVDLVAIYPPGMVPNS